MSMNGFARLAALLVVGVAGGAAGRDAAAQAQPADASACVARTKRGDMHEYVCALPRSGARHFRVVASFSGSHDDTMASLAAMRGGAPVACAAESKTSTMGEDGDVSLDCRIVLGDVGAGAREVVVVVKWSHAEFVGFEALVE